MTAEPGTAQDAL